MPTVSACLIVKNEEKFLARCLNSLHGIADEIIIVDTGSNDRTKEIAKQFTEKIYDFTWIDDFSAARNYSFSKATMEYIYTVDADEVIDEENREKFMQLKENLLPEIEIVQMKYTNQLQYNTTYNFDVELRPKLYKRVRCFRWVDPIHETIMIEPIIYDSEIEIIHMPESSHAKRDFETFQKVIRSGNKLLRKLLHMYTRELYIAGTDEDFLQAKEYFERVVEDCSQEDLKQVQCVLTKCAKIQGDNTSFFKHALKNVAGEQASAEVCYELGEFFFDLKDYKEATIWYYNAAYETSSELNIHYSGDYPLKRLAECYEHIGNQEQADAYKKLYHEWKLD
jgi:glycosyltransferase involved in cell wall biosynthesis